MNIADLAGACFGDRADGGSPHEPTLEVVNKMDAWGQNAHRLCERLSDPFDAWQPHVLLRSPQLKLSVGKHRRGKDRYLVTGAPELQMQHASSGHVGVLRLVVGKAPYFPATE